MDVTIPTDILTPLEPACHPPVLQWLTASMQNQPCHLCKLTMEVLLRANELPIHALQLEQQVFGNGPSTASSQPKSQS